MQTLPCSNFLTGFSLHICSYIFSLSKCNILSLLFHTHQHLSQSADQPLPHSVREPEVLRPTPPTAPSQTAPPDGRGTDPSLLVRSVTFVAHHGVARCAFGRVRASPCARDRRHVSCCTSNAPQLQMLLICRLMYFGESCVRALVSEASQPSN